MKGKHLTIGPAAFLGLFCFTQLCACQSVSAAQDKEKGTEKSTSTPAVDKQKRKAPILSKITKTSDLYGKWECFYVNDAKFTLTIEMTLYPNHQYTIICNVLTDEGKWTLSKDRKSILFKAGVEGGQGEPMHVQYEKGLLTDSSGNDAIPYYKVQDIDDVPAPIAWNSLKREPSLMGSWVGKLVDWKVPESTPKEKRAKQLIIASLNREEGFSLDLNPDGTYSYSDSISKYLAESGRWGYDAARKQIVMAKNTKALLQIMISYNPKRSLLTLDSGMHVIEFSKGTPIPKVDKKIPPRPGESSSTDPFGPPK